jgi:hypothetical protein
MALAYSLFALIEFNIIFAWWMKGTWDATSRIPELWPAFAFWAFFGVILLFLEKLKTYPKLAFWLIIPIFATTTAFMFNL